MKEPPADCLLALLVAARIADLQHGRVVAAKRDVGTTRPRDVVIVKLVWAQVDRGAPNPDIGGAALFVPEGRAQYVLDQANSLGYAIAGSGVLGNGWGPAGPPD